MKKRSFFNLQSLIAFAVAFIYLVLIALEMGMGEGFEITREPTLTKEYGIYMLGVGQMMAHVGAYVLLGLYFGIFAGKRESKKMLLIAMIIEAFAMSSIPSARLIVFNVIWELCWIACCVLMALYAGGKLKSRVIPVVSNGGLAWLSVFALFGMLMDLSLEALPELLYSAGATALYAVILIYYIFELRKKRVRVENDAS